MIDLRNYIPLRDYEIVLENQHFSTQHNRCLWSI